MPCPNPDSDEGELEIEIGASYGDITIAKKRPPTAVEIGRSEHITRYAVGKKEYLVPKRGVKLIKKEGGKESMAKGKGRHRLTKEEMKRGTLAALRSPKTPPHLKKYLRGRAEKEGWL